MLLKLNKSILSSIQSFNSIQIATKKQDYMIPVVKSAYKISTYQNQHINTFNTKHHFYLNKQAFPKCRIEMMRCLCSKIIDEDPEFYLEMSESETIKQASNEINLEPDNSVFEEINEEEDPEKAADNAWGDEKLYSSSNKITLKDIPRGMRNLLIYKGMSQRIQIIVGKRGVDTGLLNCLKLHFRTHDVIRCRIAKQWRDCLPDMAQELEDKSGGVILERAGSRIILYRGFTHNDIPRKDVAREKAWWDVYKKNN